MDKILCGLVIGFCIGQIIGWNSGFKDHIEICKKCCSREIERLHLELKELWNKSYGDINNADWWKK